MAYKAWANNDQGASTEVANGHEHSSVRNAENAARAELGPGWTVYIEDVDTHQQAKQFTIRK